MDLRIVYIHIYTYVSWDVNPTIPSPESDLTVFTPLVALYIAVDNDVKQSFPLCLIIN